MRNCPKNAHMEKFDFTKPEFLFCENPIKDGCGTMIEFDLSFR
jgi:hypothetical protein